MGIKPNPRRDELREEMLDLRVQLSLLEDRSGNDEQIAAFRERLVGVKAKLAATEKGYDA